MFERRKKNRSGTTSVVVVDKHGGKFKVLCNVDSIHLNGAKLICREGDVLRYTDMDEIGKICCQTRETVCGSLLVASCGDEIVVCRWADDVHTPGVVRRVASQLYAVIADSPTPAVERTFALVTSYLADGKPLPQVRHQAVGTPFQRAVWDALEAIPHGAVVSYSDVARAVGRPQAVRAVAAAIAANPLELIIPCHRVVSATGALGGYAGGVTLKRFLLDIEHGAVQ